MYKLRKKYNETWVSESGELDGVLYELSQEILIWGERDALPFAISLAIDATDLLWTATVTLSTDGAKPPGYGA